MFLYIAETVKCKMKTRKVNDKQWPLMGTFVNSGVLNEGTRRVITHQVRIYK